MSDKSNQATSQDKNYEPERAIAHEEEKVSFDEEPEDTAGTYLTQDNSEGAGFAGSPTATASPSGFATGQASGFATGHTGSTIFLGHDRGRGRGVSRGSGLHAAAFDWQQRAPPKQPTKRAPRQKIDTPSSNDESNSDTEVANRNDAGASITSKDPSEDEDIYGLEDDHEGSDKLPAEKSPNNDVEDPEDLLMALPTENQKVTPGLMENIDRL